MNIWRFGCFKVVNGFTTVFGVIDRLGRGNEVNVVVVVLMGVNGDDLIINSQLPCLPMIMSNICFSQIGEENGGFIFTLSFRIPFQVEYLYELSTREWSDLGNDLTTFRCFEDITARSFNRIISLMTSSTSTVISRDQTVARATLKCVIWILALSFRIG